jgi:hypothetical protein
MKPLFLFLTFATSISLQAQLHIRVEIKKVNNKLVFDTAYTIGDSPAFLNLSTHMSEIESAVSNGGSLTFALGQGLTVLPFSPKKRLATGESEFLNSNELALESGKKVVFNFDEEGKITDTLLTEKLDNPDVGLENFYMRFIDDSIPPIEFNIPNEIKAFFIKDQPIPALNNVNRTPCGCVDSLKNVSKETYFLLYDFSCKTFFRVNAKGKENPVSIGRIRLKHGQQLRIGIRNINRYIYDVGITADEISYDSEMPALFKNFFFGDSAKLLGSLMEAAIQGDLKDFSAAGEYNKLKNALRKFLSEFNKLKAKRLSAYMKCENFDCCDASRAQQDYIKLINGWTEIRTAAFDLSMKLLAEGSADEMQEEISFLREDFTECRKGQRNFAKIKREGEKEIEALRVKKDSAGIAKLEALIADAKKAVCPDTDTLALQIREASQKLAIKKAVDTLLTMLPTEDALTSLFMFANSIVKEHAEFVAPPIPAKGNSIELSLTMKPNDTSLVKRSSLYPLYSDSITMEIPITWGPFLSFSSGSYMTFGRSLYNKTYEWQTLPAGNNTVSDSAKFMLAETGYSNPSTGFCALLNLEIKFMPTIGFGISTGVGLTIEDKPRLSYLAGGSLFFGDRRQLVLTAGIAAMQINKLKNNWQAVFDQGINYTYTPPIEYYKEIKAGGFISISYTPFTFSSKRKTRSN